MRGVISSKLGAPRTWILASITGIVLSVVGFGVFGAFGYGIASKVAIYAGMGITVVTGFIVGIFSSWSERRKAKKLEKAVLEPGGEAQKDAAAAQAADGGASIDVMKAHFKRSLQSVKDSPQGASALVSMPWYVLVGPPGAGKTSVMQHSSLTFPQIGLELEAVPGVGGTRNCDWWFTEDAMYLDTAGRYTSQLQSRKEWLGFLSQMSRLRRKRPISGIILTVGLDQLLNLPEDKVAGYAQELRRRYDEVSEAIDFVFPVYLLFNKADLLEGFCDYFDHLDRNQRAEPLGFDLPFSRRQAGDVVSDFCERYRRLGLDLLHRRSTALTGAQMSPAAKRQALCFPGQFQFIEPRLVLFMEALLGQQPFKETGILRGVYFSSVVQLGTPVDRIGDKLSEDLGIELERKELDVGEQKVYFLPRLFSEIFLPDKDIGFLKKGVVRRNMTAYVIAAVLSIAVGVYCALNVITSAGNNRQLIDVVTGTAQELVKIQPNESDSKDIVASFERLNIVLDQLRELAQHRRQGVPDELAWGLYQGEVLYDDLRGYYFDQIRQRVLSKVRDLLVEDLDENLASGERNFARYRALFDRYHVYKMLTDINVQPVEAVMRRILINDGYWYRAIFGDKKVSKAERNLVLRHGMYVAGEATFQKEWLLEPAGSDVGAQLKNFDWVANAYQDMERVGLANVPALTSELLLGTRLSDYFTIPAVPGMYTQRGFEAWVGGELDERSKDIAGILKLIGVDRRAKELRRALLDQYRKNFSLAWKRIHGGIVVQPQNFKPLSRSVRSLGDFASQSSPYRDLYKSLTLEGQLKVTAAERSLSAAIDIAPEFDKQRIWMDPVLKVLVELRDHVQTWAENTTPGMRIDQVKELDTLIAGFIDVRKNIGDALRAIDDESQRSEKEAELLQILSHVRGAIQDVLHSDANGLWRDEVLVPYEHLSLRYPFALETQTAEQDEQDTTEAASKALSIDEFADFWHPQEGALAKVLLRIEVVAKRRLLDGPLVALDPGFRTSKRLLMTMGETWWSDPKASGPELNLHVRIIQRPWNEDVVIEIAPQKLGLYDGPQHAADMQWLAGESAAVAVRTRVNAITWLERRVSDDPWSLLRLLDQAEQKTGGRFVWQLHAQQQVSGVSQQVLELQRIRFESRRPKGRNHRYRRQQKEIPGVTAAPKENDGDSKVGDFFGGFASKAADGAMPDMPKIPSAEAPDLLGADVAADAADTAGAEAGKQAQAAVDAGKESATESIKEGMKGSENETVIDESLQSSLEIEIKYATGRGYPMLRAIQLPKKLCP